MIYFLEKNQNFNQYIKKHLQLNNGNGQFNEMLIMQVYQNRLELGCVALLDNDGYKDIYVCNGIYHNKSRFC
jgi:hypothetical protein